MSITNLYTSMDIGQLIYFTTHDTNQQLQPIIYYAHNYILNYNLTNNKPITHLHRVIRCGSQNFIMYSMV